MIKIFNNLANYLKKTGDTMTGQLNMQDDINMAAGKTVDGKDVSTLTTGVTMVTGSYTGNGTTGRTISIPGLGTIVPKLLVLWEKVDSGTDVVLFKTDQDGLYTKKAGGYYNDNRIVALIAGGFTTGSDVNDVNENGRNYTYIAFG